MLGSPFSTHLHFGRCVLLSDGTWGSPSHNFRHLKVKGVWAAALRGKGETRSFSDAPELSLLPVPKPRVRSSQKRSTSFH